MTAKKLGNFAFCKEKQTTKGFFTVKTIECETIEEANKKLAIHQIGYIIDRSNGNIVASNRSYSKKPGKSAKVGVLTKSVGRLVYR